MTGLELVITADDYGLTDATSRAIIDAHRHGVVTATSVLAVAPGVDDRLGWLGEVPELSVGVHLALVGEDPPLLTAQEIPSLVDGHGHLAVSWRQVLVRVALGRVDPDDIRREFDAQIQLVADHVHPTHLDTHQHLHLWPSIGRVVVDLAVVHGIGAVRVPRPTGTNPRGRAIARLAERLDHAAAAAGLARTDRFRGLDEAGHWTADTLVTALQALAQTPGSVEINVHPGADEDADRARFAWGYDWAGERVALQSDQVKNIIADLGFELVGR